nr:ABC transporter ATP-binding protein [uncultured Sellimonas sp.]
METVTIQNLSKTYPGGKEALKQLSLSLSAGEVFGFLGPNGAGKTTTVKLLTGVLAPSGGQCEIMGVNPNVQPEKAHLLSGIVTEHAQMYDNLTGMENLVFYAAAFGLEQKDGKQRGESLLKELELTEAKDRKLATYSTGMRQRLSLARALLHRPKVLFLDEPTSGLDPESAQNVNQMIRNLARKEGITVFLCTHQLRYAQEICTRYGLIEQGSLLASGTIEELRARVFPSKSLHICASAVPEKLNFIRCGANEFEIKIHDKKEIPDLVRKIVEAGEDIYSVNLTEPSLEDIYFALTAGRKGIDQYEDCYVCYH